MKNFDLLKANILAEMEDSAVRKITVSSPFGKSPEYFKITIIPKEGYYQFAMFFGQKVRHINESDFLSMINRLCDILSVGYKQCNIILESKSISIFLNKHFQYTLTVRASQTGVAKEKNTSHNAVKNYILQDGVPVDWLIALNIMNNQGKVLNPMQKKFRQINRFLEMIGDIADELPESPAIIDFGCGKSYLTFALYHYLTQIGKVPNIIGLDLKSDVIDECTALSKKLGYTGLNFYTGDIKNFTKQNNIDMIITLHACDTATDYALHNAIQWGAKVIMSVPCCQHELFPQIKNDDFNPLLKHGILKERFSALLTDAMRASLLEACGYKCQVMEFIDMEHTPKNILIRAVKAKYMSKLKAMSALAEFRKLCSTFQTEPTLYKLLADTLNDMQAGEL